MQEPITITLGTDLVSIQKGNKRQIQEKASTFQYVPLLEGLVGLLKKKEIFDEVNFLSVSVHAHMEDNYLFNST